MAQLKKVSGTLVVLLLLVGLPAVSYYYLKTGYTYRKDAILTQEDFGKMPDLSALPVVRGKRPASYRGAMNVVGWLDPTKPVASRQYGTMLDSLYQQFKDSPNLYFTTLVLAKDPAAAVTDFTTEHNLPASGMLTFLRADENQFARTAADFKLPLGGYDAPGEDPIVALVDSSLTVVKHYNLDHRSETIGLVQLVSVIIPLPERKDLILERAKEL